MIKRYFSWFILSGILFFLLACNSSDTQTAVENNAEQVANNTENASETETTASYRITFTAVMNDTVATSTHLTKYVGVTHKEPDVFWKLGGLSSEGVRLIAERGQQQTAIDEMTAAVAAGTANNVIIADQAIWHPKNPDPSGHPSQYQQTFTASKEYPYFSLASMIGPSPDWFVGVYNIPLFENGQFVQSKEFTLYAYDAGTKGTTEETLPHQPITVIEDPAIANIVYGTLKIEKI